MSFGKKKKWHQATGSKRDWRLDVFLYTVVVFAAIIILKLFIIQVMDHDVYRALASGQHNIFQKLYPKRGQVFVHDNKDGRLISVITNQQLGFVFADPRHVEDAKAVVETLKPILQLDDERVATLQERLRQKDDPYEPIQHGVSQDVLDKITALKLPGILITPETSRLYPEAGMGGHVLGFLGSDKDKGLSGKYGIEGYFNKILSGEMGSLNSERDIAGRIIASGNNSINPAKNGSDIVLTLDRAIQYKVCSALEAAVKKHGADSGSVVIIEPATGRILAMCGAPDFDPNHFNQIKNINDFNNPVIFNAYEPGSIFKAITMAAALDSGAITPTTTFTDTGSVMVDGWHKPLGNAEGKSYGLVDMTKVLEESINTGMVFTMRAMGQEVFVNYVKKFGFGKVTGIELDKEVAGSIVSLDKKSEVYRATASFGQGFMVTPLQVAMAFGAIANGGVLKKPLIIDEIRHADGSVEKRTPQDVAQVMSPKNARTLGAMLVSVVEHGHGKRAGVPGYYIGGKTGTAQVASASGGYSLDNTIGSFAGFGPVEDPKFAMVVRIDRPRDVVWAESTAAPLFGELAAFLLQYYEVPPIRTIEK